MSDIQKKIDDLINKIGNNLGLIDNDLKQTLKDTLKQYNDKHHSLFEATIELTNRLDKANKGLKDFFDQRNPNVQKNISAVWNEFINKSTELQIRILIDKIDTKDCSDVLKKLIEALNLKLGAVNEILKYKTEPGKPGNVDVEPNFTGGDPYYQKYLKYKSKYLRLRRIKKF